MELNQNETRLHCSILLTLPAVAAAVQGSGGQLSREQRQELRRFLTDTNYQHAKLGGAFPPLHALRSPKCEDQGLPRWEGYYCIT